MPEAVTALRPVTYYSFIHDLTIAEEVRLAAAKRMIRRHVRKALEDVAVTQVATPEDLRDYTRLASETGERMRSRDLAAVYPPAYFEAIRRQMVPRGQAVMFLARADGAPLAAATFVLSPDRCVQIHGASTRDRALTPKNGPTAVFWEAMRHATERGCTTFDMGAVTPTDDPSHAHYSVFEYKRLWGGQLVEHHAAELVVSPWRYGFQESVLAPMWDRLHPLYLRLFGARARRSEPPPEKAAGLDLRGQEQRS
jgi:lipid II:glycine glycyltransferase (peptidoglycan interpeptide bridge formation enzyme)